MGQRGPIPNPNSGRTHRGLNSLSNTKTIGDPGDWDPIASAQEFDDMIGPHGKELWHRVVPQLKDAGIMIEMDVMAFALLCYSWNQFRTASDQLKETGTSYTTARGRTEVHPYVKIRDKAADFFLTLAEKFGMTPSSRKRHGWVVAVGKEQPNPFAEYLEAGRRRN